MVEIVQVAGGGRSGFAVDVAVDAAVRPLFLQRGGRGGVGSFMGFAAKPRCTAALEPLGIPIPHVWGVDEDLDVFLVDRAEGQVWFRPPSDPDAGGRGRAGLHAPSRHLARDTGARPRAADLRSRPLGARAPARPAGRHPGACSSGRTATSPSTQLARAQLEHLLHHVPDYDGEPVLVQGDTGPGNFMYVDDRVTAIVDWELAHVGDPMDDIAWLSWRATQQGWPDFPARACASTRPRAASPSIRRGCGTTA